MYQIMNLHTGQVVAYTDSHAVAWLITVRCSWLALAY